MDNSLTADNAKQQDAGMPQDGQAVQGQQVQAPRVEDEQVPQTGQAMPVAMPTQDEEVPQAEQPMPAAMMPTQDEQVPQAGQAMPAPMATQDEQVPQAGQAMPAPMATQDEQVPQAGQAMPAPMATQDEQAPQAGQAMPAPMATQDEQAPQVGQAMPAPMATQDEQVPQAGQAMPAPMATQDEQVPQAGQAMPAPMATQDKQAPQAGQAMPAPMPTQDKQAPQTGKDNRSQRKLSSKGSDLASPTIGQANKPKNVSKIKRAIMFLAYLSFLLFKILKRIKEIDSFKSVIIAALAIGGMYILNRLDDYSNELKKHENIIKEMTLTSAWGVVINSNNGVRINQVGILVDCLAVAYRGKNIYHTSPNATECTKIYTKLSDNDPQEYIDGDVFLDRLILMDQFPESGAHRALEILNANNVSLDRIYFPKFSFQSINLKNAYMRDAIFVGTDFSAGQLGDAQFRRANLAGANMKWVKATKVDFTLANLRSVIFDSAELQDADFRRADLLNADFSNADLTGALVLQEQIDMAKGNIHTTLPEGITKPATWLEK